MAGSNRRFGKANIRQTDLHATQRRSDAAGHDAKAYNTGSELSASSGLLEDLAWETRPSG